MKPEVVFGLENAAWPALLVNASGAILVCNAAAKKLFGPPLENRSAELAAVWAPANGTDPAAFLVWWEKNRPVPFELQFRLPGGLERKFSAAIAIAPHGADKLFVLQLPPWPDSAPGHTVESPTEFRNATGDAALKQRLDCALQLARSVSLDFNNALTGVLAHTSLLLSKADPKHPWRRSLLEVEKSAARAAEIAGELALFSRQEKETRRAPAGNLNTVVSRCLDAFRNAGGARLAWRSTQERSLFEARYDEAKVQQALTRIFENAMESFEPGNPGQISVATRNVELTQATQDRNVRLAAGSYVCVEITDSGAGIEAAVLPRVFEPFFTTKRPPHRGLGLALVYGIITNHGGGVAISSQAGKGTSTRLYLPAEKTIVDQALPGDKEFHGTGTLLVVDDESLMLTMADAILTDFGYRVLTANSGQKALQVLAQPGTTVDLVITDLVMPGMGGRELMERIRQEGLGVPILAMSGYVLPESKQDQMAYLQKPFTSSDLLHKVKAALARGTVVD
ncbi:MAG: response regulator [Verrucomicrobiota bacterium]|jgi:two-component system cell cycle sensor histidine kinase/response regulator CckA